MRLKQRIAVRSSVALAAAMACLLATSAAALANTAWVSNAKPVKAPYNSCTNPGYKNIQAAIEAPTTTIHVCAGVYSEQLQINRALAIVGESGSTVRLPAVTANSTTPCDVASESATGRPDQDEISICGAFKVTIKDLDIEAIWPGEPVGEGVSCAYNLYGILAAGGANLELSAGSTVTGAAPKAINGCQYGVGVQIGMAYTDPVSTGTATLTDDTVLGYNKNGITVDGEGSKATIKDVTVTGAGLVPTAQNGIQVSNGAVGKITGSTVTKNECGVASCGDGSYNELEEDAAGVLFDREGTGSSVGSSHINENDLGVSNISGSETTKPQVTINSDFMEGDLYAAVMLGQGYATVSKDEMSGGAVGVLLLQYWAPPTQEWPPSQEFGPRGTGTEDKISGMAKYAIEGFSDNNPGDQFGSFTITKSKISGNPGATPATSVSTNNPGKLKIVTNSTDS